MRNFLLSVFTVFLLTGCGSDIKPKDLAGINGYWEIEKVKLADGHIKDYKVNETIDYFKLDGKTGFRKKLMPQLNGKYLETGTSEKILAFFKDGKAFLKYSAGYTEWEEEIMKISKDELVFKNSNDLEYHYKRQVPFSLK
ncbi:MAG: hypothetical protein EOO48_03895 [Flavobacterium sp.]|nr:MAG: hypothetical protein EOO48_03895 [Flavobacterium sp.]